MSCNGSNVVIRKATEVALPIEQGSDFSMVVTYKEDDVVVDLTDATIRSQFREKTNSADALLDLSIGNGITVTPLEGKFKLTISAADTESITALSGVWDLIITLASGAKHRLLKGTWTLDKAVTR